MICACMKHLEQVQAARNRHSTPVRLVGVESPESYDLHMDRTIREDLSSEGLQGPDTRAGAS